MRKKTLWKDTFREIKYSKSRFLSIFAIILLGVAFYAGISATGPDMLDTADTYYEDYELMDNRLFSTFGLEEEDIQELENLPHAQVQPHYTADVIETNDSTVVKLFSFRGNDSQQINQYHVNEGRLPENNGEIALDVDSSLYDMYEIGDTFSLETDQASTDPTEMLTTTEFEVVGFVSSPMYIARGSRGNTNVGSGTIDAFGVIPEEDFDMEVYTEAYVVFDDVTEEAAYTDEYADSMEQKNEQIETALAHRPEERRADIQEEIATQIEEGEQELEEGRQELADAEEQLQNARQELDDGWQVYEEGAAEFEQQTQQAREEIEQQRQQLNDAQGELDQGREELAAGQQEIANQRAELEASKEQLRAAEEGLEAIQSAEEQLNAGQQELDAQRANLEEARQQLLTAQDALQQIQSGEAALNEAQAELDQNRQALEEQLAEFGEISEEDIQSGLAAVEEGAAQLEAAEAELTNRISQLSAQLQEIEQAQAALQQIDAAETQINQQLQQLAEQRAALEQRRTQAEELPEEEREAELAAIAEQEAQLAAQETALNQQQASLEEQRRRIGATAQELEQSRVQVNQALTELSRSLEEAGFDEQRAELESQRQQLLVAQEGLVQIQQAQQSLDAGQQELNNQRANLEEARQQLDGLTQEDIDSGLAEIRNGEAQLNQAQQELDNQRARLEQEAQQLDGLDEGGIQEAWAQIESGEAQLNAAEAQLSEGLAEIETAQQQLDEGFQLLAEGEQTLEEEIASAQEELESAQAELEQGESEWQEGWAEFEEQSQEAEAQFAEAEDELADARQQLEDVPLPEYFVLDRTSNPGYLEFESNAERIASIATIFPVFFLLLAALVSLTTMTRMVDEGRSHIGTMKALGYGNSDIAVKYLTYALLASIAGAIIGLVIGYTLFPSVIFDAFSTIYNMPSIEINHYWLYTIISILGAILATAGATWLAVRSTLQNNAATLLRPKAPKKGQRILLEKIPFIWNRLGFNQKVAARNLFRYKRRMLMTVIGVAGGTALMLTGFGLSDSISGVAELQFGRVHEYDGIVALNTEADEEELNAYEETLAESPAIEAALPVHQETTTMEQRGVNPQDVTLFVPESPEELTDFTNLIDYQTEELYELPGDGVLATQKLSSLFGFDVGDEVTVSDADNEDYTFTVQGIIENYVGHMLYMTPEVYEQATGNEPEYGTELISFPSDSVDEDELGSVLTEEPAVAGATFVSLSEEVLQDSLDSLDVVMVVLISSAAALSFIVLYNLTNINVSERIRELSTIKVLGFYDKEVTMYIYRENLVLTILGILTGLILGVLLHQFVIQTAEQDMMMFSRTVHWTSYLYSALLTFVFSTIVMIVMHFKLKSVDMVEALKEAD